MVAEKRLKAMGPAPDEVVRFITLMKPLATLLPTTTAAGYWNELDLLVDEMIEAQSGSADGYRITHLDATTEYAALVAEPRTVRNWATPLRTSPIYRDLFGAVSA